MSFRIKPAPAAGLSAGGTITGNLVITGTLNVQGAVTLNVAQTVLGTLTVDVLNLATGVAYQTEFDATDAAEATPTIDWNDGNKQLMTLDVNVTLAFTDPPGPANLVLRFVQDGVGTNTVAWPASVKWEGGSAPTISAGAADVDIVTLYFDGTSYYGGFLQDFS